MKSLHISLNTAHSECKPSTFMSSSTQVFLFLPLHLTPATSTLLQAHTQSYTLLHYSCPYFPIHVPSFSHPWAIILLLSHPWAIIFPSLCPYFSQFQAFMTCFRPKCQLARLARLAHELPTNLSRHRTIDLNARLKFYQFSVICLCHENVLVLWNTVCSLGIYNQSKRLFYYICTILLLQSWWNYLFTPLSQEQAYSNKFSS